MNAENSIAVVADVSANVIKVLFIGALGPREMECYSEEIARGVKALRPGFTLYTDFADLKRMSPDCVPAMEKTMDLMRSKGVGLVVRVIPDPKKDIGVGILSLFHYPHSLKIITTNTREEADAVLAHSK